MAPPTISRSRAPQHLAVSEMNDVALRDAERQEKQHHAGAVVEQALADDGGAQVRRQTDLAQQIFDHDRVGRRKDRAQNDAPGQRNGRSR